MNNNKVILSVESHPLGTKERIIILFKYEIFNAYSIKCTSLTCRSLLVPFFVVIFAADVKLLIIFSTTAACLPSTTTVSSSSTTLPLLALVQHPRTTKMVSRKSRILQFNSSIHRKLLLLSFFLNTTEFHRNNPIRSLHFLSLLQEHFAATTLSERSEPITVVNRCRRSITEELQFLDIVIAGYIQPPPFGSCFPFLRILFHTTNTHRGIIGSITLDLIVVSLLRS